MNPVDSTSDLSQAGPAPNLSDHLLPDVLRLRAGLTPERDFLQPA
ncbi:MAG: hypothetical protein QOE60_1800, partial [Thermoleophilaceae bacterium]|nr:hypothetical protein [Thermoleophilaceae bacterium]